MKNNSRRGRALSAALTIALSLGAGSAAALAQGQDFYVYQLNSSVRDLNKVIDRINDAKIAMKSEKDFARGCATLNGLIQDLKEAQLIAEKMADYAARADDMDAHRSAVDQHNAYLEERHFWEGEHSRICG